MKQWEQIARERFILRKIPDYQGRPMYTEERLFTYLQQFERDFARSKARIIDATEGGAAKRGAEVMTLADVIDSYCESDSLSRALEISNLKSEMSDLRSPTEEVRVSDCLDRRAGEARRIEEICRATLPLLEEIRDHVDDQPRVNRAISAVDSLRARMNELGATYDLVTQLTQSTELRRFKADRMLSAAQKLDENERQRRQIARDIDNVLAVADAARDFQQLMRDTIDLLDRRFSHFSEKQSPNTQTTREAA
jgi:hypothetical protein